MILEDTPSGNLRLYSKDRDDDAGVRLTRDEIRAAAALLVISGAQTAAAPPRPATSPPAQAKADDAATAIPTDPDALLTVDEVAQLLRVSTDSVYLYARTGRLPKVQFERAVRFKRCEVLSFIERATSKPAKLVPRR